MDLIKKIIDITLIIVIILFIGFGLLNMECNKIKIETNCETGIIENINLNLTDSQKETLQASLDKIVKGEDSDG